MNKTIRSLAAAAAAAASLALASLAVISPAAASTTTTSSTITAASQPNAPWAGWVDTMNNPGAHRFASVHATFKVPGINCSKSVIGGPELPGGPYSAAAFWVGLDGSSTDQHYLEQAGIDATCSGPKAYAQYNAWYQMTPTKNVTVTLTGSKHNPGTVRVGDTIQVQVWDTAGLTPQDPKWQDPNGAGYAYSVGIQDTTRHISWYHNGLRPSNYPGYGGGRAPDSSAEVITEAVSNGPFAGDNLKTNPWAKGPATIGLADMGTVSYTDVYVSSDVNGWIYGMNMHSNGFWTATPWNAGHERYFWIWGQNKQDHNKWEWYKVYTYWETLINPGSLGGRVGDYSAPFSTYWK